VIAAVDSGMLIRLGALVDDFSSLTLGFLDEEDRRKFG
jgi:hypothetical protein